MLFFDAIVLPLLISGGGALFSLSDSRIILEFATGGADVACLVNLLKGRRLANEDWNLDCGASDGGTLEDEDIGASVGPKCGERGLDGGTGVGPLRGNGEKRDLMD